jgi:hypothetical protein
LATPQRTPTFERIKTEKKIEKQFSDKEKIIEKEKVIEKEKEKEKIVEKEKDKIVEKEKEKIVEKEKEKEKSEKPKEKEKDATDGEGSRIKFGLFKKEKSARTDEMIEEEEYIKLQKRREKNKMDTIRREMVTRGQKNPIKCSEYFQTADEEELRQKNYRFITNTLEDLPPDIHGSLERMNLPLQMMLDNFEILLNVLSFADKHIPRRR